MWIGRAVFGLGGESLSVAKNAIIAKWFVGKELAFGEAMSRSEPHTLTFIPCALWIAVAVQHWASAWLSPAWAP